MRALISLPRGCRRRRRSSALAGVPLLADDQNFQPWNFLFCRSIWRSNKNSNGSSRNNCFFRDNRSCEAHGPHKFAMKKGFLFLFPGMRSMCLMSNCELMCCASFSFTSSERDDFWPPLGPVFRRAIGLGTALTSVPKGRESAIFDGFREVTVLWLTKTRVDMEL